MVPYRSGENEDIFLSSSFKEKTQHDKSMCSESSPLVPETLTECRGKGVVGLKICFRYLWEGNSPLTLISVTMLLISAQVCSSGIDMMLSVLSRAMGKEDIWWTQFYLASYAGLIVLNFLLGLMGNLFFFYACVSASRHLHKYAVGGLIRSKLEFFETNPTGRIMNRFSKDLILVDDNLPNTVSAVIDVRKFINHFCPLLFTLWNLFFVLSSTQFKSWASLLTSPF